MCTSFIRQSSSWHRQCVIHLLNKALIEQDNVYFIHSRKLWLKQSHVYFIHVRRLYLNQTMCISFIQEGYYWNKQYAFYSLKKPLWKDNVYFAFKKALIETDNVYYIHSRRLWLKQIMCSSFIHQWSDWNTQCVFHAFKKALIETDIVYFIWWRRLWFEQTMCICIQEGSGWHRQCVIH